MYNDKYNDDEGVEALEGVVRLDEWNPSHTPRAPSRNLLDNPHTPSRLTSGTLGTVNNGNCMITILKTLHTAVLSHPLINRGKGGVTAPKALKIPTFPRLA